MLFLSSSARYFLNQHPVDMHCGIYSLAGLVQNNLGLDPLSGDMFIFIGKRGNQLRRLQWDRDGYAMFIKRLEAGTQTGNARQPLPAGGRNPDAGA
jgi:transposase